jgi:general secretion pathway protein D
MAIITTKTNFGKKWSPTLMVALCLAGCSGSDDKDRFKPRIAHPVTIHESATDEANNATGLASDAPQHQGRAEYIEGTGQFSKPSQNKNNIKLSSANAVSLNFRNTDIRVIIRAILSETLGVRYLIDPRVQGKASLESSGPVSPEALRLSLETLLKTQGYALVSASDGYNILPISEAPANIRSFSETTAPASVNLPGFGVNIVTLKHTTPSDIKSIIEPLSPSGGILHSDDSRQIMILAGTSQEISSMLHIIETFDVDKMAGMSFGIFRLNYVEAEQVVKELKDIFNSASGKDISRIQLLPISRINRVIAISPSKSELTEIENWIERLDIGESAPGRRIYVYKVKNGRAGDLAATLNAILGINAAPLQQNTNTIRRSRSNQTRRTIQQTSSQNTQRPSDNNDAIRVVPSNENNSLIIMASPTEYASIESALKKIDLPPQQVLIEVTLAEVTLNDELRYGVQWNFEFGNNSVSLGSAAAPQNNTQTGAGGTAFNGFTWNFNNNSSVNGILTALSAVTDVKVISSPKLLVLNNQSATIQVGDEVPVLSATAVSTTAANAPVVNSIEYRDTGIILSVTPRIGDDGIVMIDVDQEVSNVVETATSGIDAPTIQQRRVTSTVSALDGATVALGGLIQTTLSTNDSGVPFLKDIPVLGIPFKDTNIVERRSELIILMTPRIIKDATKTRDLMNHIRSEFRNILGEADLESVLEE